MKALVFESPENGVRYKADYPVPLIKEGQLSVKLLAAALNHRDVWITQGLYPGIRPNVIVGSDGAGIVDDKRVIINPNIGWGASEVIPAPAYSILGMPKHGTFAEFVSVAEDRIHEVPNHLSNHEAAALPLAGLTAYRAVFSKGKLKKNERVFISGVGGGVALIAAQFAIAAGAEVFVSSGSDEKIKKAKELGAIGGINYRTVDWKKASKEIGNSFDLIIDSAGGESFNQLLKLAAPGGRVVIYGGTLGAIPKLSPQLVFWKQISILGTTMGSDNDFKNMLNFVKDNKIKPVIDKIFPIEEGTKAFQRMAEGKQFGKIILSI